MEWIVGIYLSIGVINTLVRYSNPNPMIKPAWMFGPQNPLVLAILFTVYTLFWPMTLRK